MENEVGFLRLKSVLEIIPVSRSTFLNGIKSGKFPSGVLLTPRTRAWRKKDILALAEELSGEKNEQ